MSGVPGRGGVVPKRSEERRRRNKVDTDKVDMVGAVKVPAANEEWHPIAVDWFESLAISGQAKYYEPSDWAAAVLLANEMSGMLLAGRPSAVMFAAVWSAMGDLLTTEGERRRVRLEINRRPEGASEPVAKVTRLDDYRNL